ncbi:MAG TPA: hypothetical protein DHV16_07250 [Nitrospiraceae bacterium]|nr:hypothetical protein [Nitrospiraceae bacterium]HCL81424.1 hypothetical protein [Nitrospiraceae bacterium]HCZ12037.1 hypothetical protein [Nitrospiraceae bacterium]
MPTKTKKQVKTGSKKKQSDKKSKPKPKVKTKQKAVKPKVQAKKAQPKSKPKSAPKQKAKPKAPVKAKKASRPKESVVESEKDRNERLRKLLLQKREDIVREAKSEIKKFKSGENKQLVETVMDDGDLSVVDLSEDISLKQLSTHRETLIKIDAALRKLAEGTYGACEECGDDISEQRLNIMPFAIYCRDCQEKKELMEKIEREVV